MFVVPVYNVIVVPEARILFQTDRFTQLAGRSPEEGEHVIFLVQKREESREELTADSFYPIGVSGVIKEVNPNGYLIVETTARVNVDSVRIGEEQRIELNVTPRADISDTDPEDERERLEKLKAALIAYTSGFQWGPIARNYIMQWRNLNEIAAGMSQWMGNPPEDKYAILATDSKSARNDLIEKGMYEYIEIARLTTEAENEQEQDYRKAYRENAIRKQMDYLQKQLDEMHPENVSEC